MNKIKKTFKVAASPNTPISTSSVWECYIPRSIFCLFDT